MGSPLRVGLDVRAISKQCNSNNAKSSKETTAEATGELSSDPLLGELSSVATETSTE